MMARPLERNIFITSPFGFRIHPVTREKARFHNGVDIRAKVGTDLLAIADGLVRVSKINGGGSKKGYGYYIVIEHDNFCSLYGHLNKLSKLKVGQKIKKGDVIGQSGNSGQSTGPHLHFEIRKGNYDSTFWRRNSEGKYINAVDPEKFDIKGDENMGTIFKDVEDSRWSAEQIKKAAKLGIIKGNGDGNFNPEGYLTREQAAVIAVRIIEAVERKCK